VVNSLLVLSARIHQPLHVTRPHLPLLAALITVVLWGSAFVAIRIAVPGLGAAGLSVTRLVLASVVLAVVAPLLGLRRPPARALPGILGCGVTGMTAYQLLLNAGESTVPAGTASLLMSTAPLFAAFLAYVSLGEPLGRRVVAGSGLGFVGAAIIAVASGPVGHPNPVGGVALVLGAAVVQALFFVLQRPLLRRHSATEVTCWAMWAGTLLTLPCALPFVGPALHDGAARIDRGVVLAVAFLGIGPSALGFTTWAYAQARMTTAAATATLYLVPLVAVTVGWLLLAEVPAPLSLLGGALCLSGVALTRMSPKTRPAQDSRTTSSGDLSGRRPRHEGWRIRPSSVHSPNATSPTSAGRTQRASRVSARGNS